jgi:photosystem II stability/assembly factor-like uncharacterized protein
MSKASLVLTLLLVTVHAAGAQGRGAGGGPQATQPVEPLRFQYLGPASSGRVAAVAGVPGDTMTYFLGASSGGVWKTTDGGTTWTPTFDAQKVQAIGALAVAPSDHNVVWAGTGEAWVIRDADVMGDGVYKSTDGGMTWTHMGLPETGRIGRIVIDPTNPDIVHVCAIGRTTGPQQERGVFRTTDGGKTWTRTLFVNENTGCSGLAIDPNDPNTLFAGTWEVVMHTYAMYSGGPGSGVYVSHDRGATWTHIEDPGLPHSPVGKIDVAVAPSNSKRVFALIQTANQGSVWRSDDGGAHWKVVSYDRTLIGRAGYYIRIAVNPKNDNEVLIANSTFKRSMDGGATWPLAGGGCGDCHDIWMDPLNGDHWAVTGDNTQGITKNHGRTFSTIALPIGQMYHVALDNRSPYWVYSNRQDNGTMRGRSDAPIPVTNVPSYFRPDGIGTGPMGRGRGFGGGGGFAGGGRGGAPDSAQAAGGRGGAGDSTAGGRGAPPPDSANAGGRGGRGGVGAAAGAPQFPTAPAVPWQTGLGGCESGFTVPLPRDPEIIWASCYGNEVTRFDSRIGRARSVSPWIHTLDSPPNLLKYRCHWTPPLAVDPFDPETVYYGCQVIFRTTNKGQSWMVISPDLSTRDSSIIIPSGGIIEDNLGQFYGAVVFDIAPSEIQRGLIWAGTNDGKIWYTRDGGIGWNDVTKNVTGLPKGATVRQIYPSRFSPAEAFVAVDNHLMDDRKPYLFRTTDFGKTWTSIVGDLPADHPLAYTMTVAENPNRRGMLFAGTGNGFFYSMNGGTSWTRFDNGLPAAPVSWIAPQKDFHDVVISTYGRGLFVLRDISPLEQRDQVTAAGSPYLYEPRTAFRDARDGSATFEFALKTQPKTVALEILDSAGTAVRKMPLRARAGENRVTWNLQYDEPVQVELRTSPPDNPHIWEEQRFKGRSTRPINHWGIQNPQRAGALASPGRYTARLTVDSVTVSRPFRVALDPEVKSTQADLVASTRTQLRIVTAMNDAAGMINGIESARKQIEDLTKSDSTATDLKTALHGLDDKLFATEMTLLSKTDLHSDDKWYVEPYKLYMQLIWLSGEVGLGAGDVQGGADQRPTDASLAWLADIERQLGAVRADFQRLATREVPAFNRTYAGKLPAIMLKGGPVM